MFENDSAFYNQSLPRYVDPDARNKHHCQFCDKLLVEHYYMENKKISVCPDCFAKYKEHYKWTVKDWRLTFQEDYLMKSELKHVTDFKKFSDEWDHEHCCFCTAKFMEGDYPEVIHEGYCTLDEKRWICPTCYEDFKERFKWKLVDDPTESA